MTDQASGLTSTKATWSRALARHLATAQSYAVDRAARCPPSPQVVCQWKYHDHELCSRHLPAAHSAASMHRLRTLAGPPAFRAASEDQAEEYMEKPAAKVCERAWLRHYIVVTRWCRRPWTLQLARSTSPEHVLVSWNSFQKLAVCRWLLRVTDRATCTSREPSPADQGRLLLCAFKVRKANSNLICETALTMPCCTDRHDVHLGPGSGRASRTCSAVHGA